MTDVLPMIMTLGTSVAAFAYMRLSGESPKDSGGRVGGAYEQDRRVTNDVLDLKSMVQSGMNMDNVPALGSIDELAYTKALVTPDGRRYHLLYHGCSKAAYQKYVQPLLVPNEHDTYGKVMPRDESVTTGANQSLGKGMYVTYCDMLAKRYAGPDGVILLVYVSDPEDVTYMEIRRTPANGANPLVDHLDAEVDILVGSDSLLFSESALKCVQFCKITRRFIDSALANERPITFVPQLLEDLEKETDFAALGEGVLQKLYGSAKSENVDLNETSELARAYTDVNNEVGVEDTGVAIDVILRSHALSDVTEDLWESDSDV